MDDTVKGLITLNAQSKQHKEIRQEANRSQLEESVLIMQNRSENDKGKIKTCLVELRKRDKQLFTKREIEIIEQLATGKLSKEIARDLHITQSTVKNHIMNIVKKSKIDTRTGIVVYALQQGYIYLDIIKVEQRDVQTRIYE